ncbi:MAG: glycosyltransferase family 39 protein [Elusimicrobiota bacterium]|jgi:4-amino-4-deoxy-L-arabinose transferase-like glycosyltransferase|nr:glycosyltransferase family 39 protein [Elusimicrobiota bacterium]
MRIFGHLLERDLSRVFWHALIISVLIKLILSILIPITSDEAYFALWGRYLDFGYYDHPPMIGWILYLMQKLSSNTLIIRLPAVLFSTFIGIGIYNLLKNIDKQKAALIAALYIVSPINMLNIIITTDAPLILFSFLSVISLYKAMQKQSYGLYLICGVFLGLAFLSKYFAGLLGFSYLFYFVFSEKNKKKTIGFAILFASIIPFVILNLYWNWNNMWANIMFNMVNRSVSDGVFKISKGLVFLACQFYLITPPIFYYAIKNRSKWKTIIKTNKDFAIFSFALIVPITIFALISFKQIVGLHWALSFYPFMYILLFLLLTQKEIIKSVKFMIIFL